MTAQEAKQRLERIWKAYTSAYDTVSIEDLMAFDIAINALQAQDSKTIRICDTCKHDPPEMDKWPCMDCDMREPADRWEAQDVPDTNVGDMISRRDAIDVAFDIFPDDEYFREQFVKGIEALPSAQPEIAIPLSWIEKHIEWLKSMDNAFSDLTAMNISVMVKKWKEEKERKTNG